MKKYIFLLLYAYTSFLYAEKDLSALQLLFMRFEAFINGVSDSLSKIPAQQVSSPPAPSAPSPQGSTGAPPPPPPPPADWAPERSKVVAPASIATKKAHSSAPSKASSGQADLMAQIAKGVQLKPVKSSSGPAGQIESSGGPGKQATGMTLELMNLIAAQQAVKKIDGGSPAESDDEDWKEESKTLTPDEKTLKGVELRLQTCILSNHKMAPRGADCPKDQEKFRRKCSEEIAVLQAISQDNLKSETEKYSAILRFLQDFDVRKFDGKERYEDYIEYLEKQSKDYKDKVARPLGDHSNLPQFMKDDILKKVSGFEEILYRADQQSPRGEIPAFLKRMHLVRENFKLLFAFPHPFVDDLPLRPFEKSKDGASRDGLKAYLNIFERIKDGYLVKDDAKQDTRGTRKKDSPPPEKKISSQYAIPAYVTKDMQNQINALSGALKSLTMPDSDKKPINDQIQSLVNFFKLQDPSQSNQPKKSEPSMPDIIDASFAIKQFNSRDEDDLKELIKFLKDLSKDDFRRFTYSQLSQMSQNSDLTEKVSPEIKEFFKEEIQSRIARDPDFKAGYEKMIKDIDSEGW